MFLWELKNAIISTNLRELCVIETPKPSRKIPLHSGFDKLSHRVIYYYSRCLSLLKARSYSSLWFRLRSITVLFITTLGAWACRRHILTSNLGAWASSKAHYFYYIKIRALYRKSLMFLWELKNAIISTNFRELCDIKTNTKNPHTHSGFDKLSHQLFHYTLPEPVEGTLFLFY